MINVAARVRILGSIQTGAVYYFEEEQLNSPEPHYFIVLNKNPRTEEVLILVCASSQVEKRKQIAKKLNFPADTLVIISPAEYSLFTKETVVDCNTAFDRNVQSLIDKLEQGKLKICTELMSEDIVDKLVKGVIASTQIAENIKIALSDTGI
jgi:hypothetical protein